MTIIKKEILINGVKLVELRGSLPSDFTEAVDMLTRPYITISEKEYNLLRKNTTSDFLLYKDKVVTFGNADGGYALMPLQNKYASEIKKEKND